MKKQLLIVVLTSICISLQMHSALAQNKTVIGTPSNPIKQPEDKPGGGGSLPELVIRGNGSSQGDIDRAKGALDPSSSPRGNGSMSRGGTAKPSNPSKPGKSTAPPKPGARDMVKGQFKKMTGLFSQFLGAVGEGGINIGELLNDLIDNNGNTSVKNVISGDGVHLTSYCLFNCTTVFTNNGDSYQQIVITDGNGKILGTASTNPSRGKK